MPEFKGVDNLILLYVFKEIMVNNNIYHNTQVGVLGEVAGYMNFGLGREMKDRDTHLGVVSIWIYT